MTSIVVGPDHDMWLADPCGGLIQMTMAGVVTEHPLNGFTPTQVTVGADQRFYMTQKGTDVIGVADTSGNFQTFAIPSRDTISDGGITLGPDGDVWFAESFHIGKITPTGTITEYLYDSSQTSPNTNGGVATGADGNVWVSDVGQFGERGILWVNPTTGAVTPLDSGCGSPGPVLTVKPPSSFAVWELCGNAPFMITVNEFDKLFGYQTAWPVAGGVNALPQAMVAGPMGDPWWASTGGTIVWLDPRSKTVTAYLPPDQTDSTDAIAFGPDGNLWGVTADGKVDVYILKVLSVTPASLAFAGIGQQQTLTVSERGHPSWTASSSDTSVATVARGNMASQFIVTSVGDGSRIVTVSDKIGNSFPVAVTVSQTMSGLGK